MTSVIKKEPLTIRLHEDWRQMIDALVEKGIFDSVSDCVRKSVRNTLIEYGYIDALAESSKKEKDDTSNGVSAHEEVSEPEATVV